MFKLQRPISDGRVWITSNIRIRMEGGYIGVFECNTVTTSVNTGDFERRECNMLQCLSVTKTIHRTQNPGGRSQEPVFKRNFERPTLNAKL